MSFSETTFLLLMAIVNQRGCNELNEYSKENINKDKREVSFTKYINSNEHNQIVTYPAEGCGYFRDPLEILGPKFPIRYTIHLCELHIYTFAEELSKVRFTPRGKKTCMEVCVQYRKGMMVDGQVTVQLLHSYCNYIGTSPGNNEIGLDRACSCPYSIRCKERVQLITYTFEPNCHGYLKVAVFQSKFHRYIT